MSSSDSKTFLSTDQSKPSQQNVLERVADRSAKKILNKNMVAIYVSKKKVIDYNNPEMLWKFTSQMVEYYHQKIQTNNSEKNRFKIENKLISLKLDP